MSDRKSVKMYAHEFEKFGGWIKQHKWFQR